MLKHFTSKLLYVSLLALPAFGGSRLDTFESLVDEGNRLHHAGMYSQAEEKYRAATRVAEDSGLAPVHLATVLGNLGSVLYQNARLADAEECFRKAAEYWAKSPSTLGEEGRAILLNNLGALYRAQGRYAEGEKAYNEAIDIRRRQGLAASLASARLWCNLAELLRHQGKLNEARVAVDRGRTIGIKTVAHDSDALASMLQISGDVYRDLKSYEESEAFHLEALAIREKLFGADHPSIAVGKNNLASVYSEQGAIDRAVPLIEDALRIWRGTFGEDHPFVGVACNNLGLAYVSMNRSVEAEPLYRKSIEIIEKRLGTEHPDVASAYRNLGYLFHRQGKLQGAEKIYRHAAGILEKSLSGDPLQLAALLKDVVAVLIDQQRFQEAENTQKRVLQIIERSGTGHAEYLTQAQILEQLRRRNGRRASARL